MIDEPPPSEPVALTAVVVRRWYETALAAFEEHRKTINALNVYPVPDGDTGTNLVGTMRAALEAVAGPDATLPDVTYSAARGALLAARGNSGVILAQLLRGFADAWGVDTVDGPRFAVGLRRAAESAADAVAEPAPGTILTIAAAAADAADAARAAPLPVLVRSVASSAAEALARTTDQLPALARAGVVDAGGFGLALMLDALTEVVVGKPTGAAIRVVESGSRTARMRVAAEVPRESGSTDFAYEVQYLVDATVDAAERLRCVLSGLGDSLVVVGAADGDEDGLRPWNIHVHVNDVGAAVEAGIEAGRLHRLSVTRFADGPASDLDRPASLAAEPFAVEVNRGVVVVLDAPALRGLVEAEGARVVVASAELDVDAIEAAIRGTGHTDVVVVTRSWAIESTERAAAAARADGFRVAVVPTRSPVQALAALAVRQPERRFDDDVIAMAEAAGSCRHADVSVAVREGLTSVGRCRPGDFLAHADGDVVLLGHNRDEVVTGVVDRLCAAGAELVTVIAGATLPKSSVDYVAAHLARAWPLVEVQIFDGGQREPLVWIGAE
ncbi:DhaL domain-containing protein [Stackebrandtia soli]